MDLVNCYSSGSDSSPPASPAHPPATPQVTKLVTGTIEAVDFSEAAFYQLQRSNEAHQPPVAPRRNRPESAHVQASKRPKPPSSSSAQSGSAAQSAPKRPRVNGRSEEASKGETAANAKHAREGDANSAELQKTLPFVPTSELHVAEERDYRNRSWAAPPPGARSFDQLETYTPYVPKRATHERDAHAGGVSVVRIHPPFGHVVLSAGLDGRAVLWDAARAKKLRTYHGHSRGVRDAVFAADGRTFLTGGYDRAVRLWDVETGRVTGSYTFGGTPICLRFAPGAGDDAPGTEFVAGCADRKVVQMDVRDASGVVQTYDQHMGAVNSVSFVDDGRRFVSSCEDKVLRVWEYGVPVVLRHISEPGAHSMPFTMLHPGGKWLACQSMDNSVRLFSAKDKFKANTKRSFKGHLVAGYACGLTASPDGRFLASADSMGRMFFWDWKSARLLRAVQAHKGVCFTVAWHCTRPSFVVSGGWDGKIKFWD